jgi:hemerythrin HHE cation binding domain-containing protein
MKPNTSTTDQALLDDLRRHRAELRESMGALEDVLAAPATSDWVRWGSRAQAALMELAGDFKAHVEITEGPHGLYQDLRQNSPRLSQAVTRLTQEHVMIGSQLESLLTKATTVATPEEVNRVRELGTALLGRLVRHRQAGADLVYEAYEVDIGGET